MRQHSMSHDETNASISMREDTFASRLRVVAARIISRQWVADKWKPPPPLSLDQRLVSRQPVHSFACNSGLPETTSCLADQQPCAAGRQFCIANLESIQANQRKWFVGAVGCYCYAIAIALESIQDVWASSIVVQFCRFPSIRSSIGSLALGRATRKSSSSSSRRAQVPLTRGLRCDKRRPFCHTSFNFRANSRGAIVSVRLEEAIRRLQTTTK